MGSKILYRAYLTGTSVTPYTRMTRRGKHIDERAKKYNAQQQMLAEWFSAIALKDKVQCPLPERVKFEAVVAYTDRRKRDWSNVAKALEDALVKSGVVVDDSASHMPEGWCVVKLGKKEPYTIVQLREYVESNRLEREVEDGEGIVPPV